MRIGFFTCVNVIHEKSVYMHKLYTEVYMGAVVCVSCTLFTRSVPVGKKERKIVSATCIGLRKCHV